MKAGNDVLYLRKELLHLPETIWLLIHPKRNHSFQNIVSILVIPLHVHNWYYLNLNSQNESLTGIRNDTIYCSIRTRGSKGFNIFVFVLLPSPIPGCSNLLYEIRNLVMEYVSHSRRTVPYFRIAPH